MQKEKNKKTKKRDPIPKSFASLSEAAAFWDTHDSADYEDMMDDVDFDVKLERRVFLVPVPETLFGVIRKKARSQGLSTETMVNLLLQEQAR
jgi:hypothetical protein